MSTNKGNPVSDYESQALNDLPLFRQTDPVTSQEAGEKLVMRGRRSALTAQLLDLIRSHPGLIGEEIDELADVEDRELSKRAGDLKKLGLIEAGKPKRNRKNNNCETLWPIGEVPEDWKVNQ